MGRSEHRRRAALRPSQSPLGERRSARPVTPLTEDENPPAASQRGASPRPPVAGCASGEFSGFDELASVSARVDLGSARRPRRPLTSRLRRRRGPAEPVFSIIPAGPASWSGDRGQARNVRPSLQHRLPFAGRQSYFDRGPPVLLRRTTVHHTPAPIISPALRHARRGVRALTLIRRSRSIIPHPFRAPLRAAHSLASVARAVDEFFPRIDLIFSTSGEPPRGDRA